VFVFFVAWSPPARISKSHAYARRELTFWFFFFFVFGWLGGGLFVLWGGFFWVFGVGFFCGLFFGLMEMLDSARPYLSCPFLS